MILDGKKYAQEITDNLLEKISKLEKKLHLAVILVGNNPASELYVRMKKKMAQKLGINVTVYEFSEEISEENLLSEIQELNEDVSVTGILVQIPLPKHIDEYKILNSVDYKKDVDGLTESNFSRISSGKKGLQACTPKGIISLLKHYTGDISGKNMVILGKGTTVGRPLIFQALNAGCTVTVCHKSTRDLNEHLRNADIIVSATGVAHIIHEKLEIKKDAILVDVGVSKKDGKIYGDIDFDFFEKNHKITPNPGGIGPMTIAMLMENIYEIWKNDQSI